MKSDLIASQTSRNQIAKVGRGADIGRVMKPNPQNQKSDTPKPHPKIGMEFQQDRHHRNQIRETLKLTFINIFRFQKDHFSIRRVQGGRGVLRRKRGEQIFPLDPIFLKASMLKFSVPENFRFFDKPKFVNFWAFQRFLKSIRKCNVQFAFSRLFHAGMEAVFLR